MDLAHGTPPDRNQATGTGQFQFGEFVFDPETLELHGEDSTVRLQPQPASLLELLIAHRGAVVSRDAIRRHLWPDEVHVEFDQCVNTCVKRIRTAMGDRAESPRYIETVPRRGYRFLQPVLVIEDEEPEEAATDATGGRPQPTTIAALAWVGATLGVGLFVWHTFVSNPRAADEPPRHVLVFRPFTPLEPWAGSEPFRRALTQETLTALCSQRSPFLTVVVQEALPQEAAGGPNTPESEADFLLDGRVHREAGRLSVWARLVQAKDGTVLWSDSWEGAESVLDLQTHAGRQIGDAVRNRLARLDPSSQRERNREARAGGGAD